MAKIENRKIRLKFLRSHPWNKIHGTTILGHPEWLIYFSLTVGNYKYCINPDKELVRYDREQFLNRSFFSARYHYTFRFEKQNLDKVKEICQDSAMALIYSGIEDLALFCKLRQKYFGNTEIQFVI